MATEVTVTKEQVEAFEEVRQSGVCNMLSQEARAIAGLTRDEHIYIISNYEALIEKFNINTDGAE